MTSSDNILVETGELAEQLGDPALRVFDCTVQLDIGPEGLTIRSGRESWTASHIPGSDFLDLLEELSDTTAPYRFTAPTAVAFADAMSAHGVDDGTRVVLYDSRDSSWAARVWWLLRGFGFDKAAVLNGGWTKWTLEGRPTSSAPPEYPPSSFVARRRPGVFVGREDVLAGIAGGTCLLNGLSEESHRGTGPTVPNGRPGHIPTSKSMPADDLVDSETQAFLPADQLRARLEQRGALSADGVITYCGGGIAAAGVAFALKLVGHENVSIYDASLEEWATDPALPIETG
jgi:thiosulfate/3-mercaptopyruvate sulfurtransferase